MFVSQVRVSILNFHRLALVVKKRDTRPILDQTNANQGLQVRQARVYFLFL
jgi:hypothetical protein